jgi:tetratricopeptide (TPR) repeat protein
LNGSVSQAGISPDDAALVESVRGLVRASHDALNHGDGRRATWQLAQSASRLEDVQEHDLRRREYESLAVVCLRVGLPELSLNISRTVLQLDRELGDVARLIENLLSYGWALRDLSMRTEAKEAFRQALDLAVAERRWANAASASTNLATVMAEEGQLEEAERRLGASLGYLEQEPFPDTEAKTRFALLQVRSALGLPASECLDLARDALDRFGALVAPLDRQQIVATVGGLVGRLRAEHPELDQQAIEARFPELNER